MDRKVEHRKLPANHEQMSPSDLLVIMRPQTRYTLLDIEGIPPNAIHHYGITVDGQEYIGAARSKKEARKAAASEACKALFTPPPVDQVVSVIVWFGLVWFVCGT